VEFGAGFVAGTLVTGFVCLVIFGQMVGAGMRARARMRRRLEELQEPTVAELNEADRWLAEHGCGVSEWVRGLDLREL